MEPLIRNNMPGPKARAVLERDATVVSPFMVRGYPLVIEREEGMNLRDVDGNRYLDFPADSAAINEGGFVRLAAVQSGCFAADGMVYPGNLAVPEHPNPEVYYDG